MVAPSEFSSRKLKCIFNLYEAAGFELISCATRIIFAVIPWKSLDSTLYHSPLYQFVLDDTDHNDSANISNNF